MEIYRDIYWFDYVYVLKCPRKLEYILICILTWPNIYFDLSKGVEIYLDLYLDLLSICLDLSLSMRVEIYFDIFCLYIHLDLSEYMYWMVKGIWIYFDLHLNLTKYLFWLPKGVNFTLPSLPVPNWPLVPQMPLDRATRPTRSKLGFALRNKWHPYISFFFMFDIVTLDSEWFFFTE